MADRWRGSRQGRTTWKAGGAALAVILTVAACGGSGSKPAATQALGTAAQAEASATSSTTTPPTTGAPAGVPAGQVAPRPGGGGAPTTQVSPTTAAARNSASPAPRPSGNQLAPPAPGNYRYKQRGTKSAAGSTRNVPGEGTLTVDAAQPDGAQTWHRRVDPSSPPSDTTFLFRSDGLFIASLVQRSGESMQFTCTFNPPLPAPPWPPTVGRAFSGRAQCDGFTLDVSSRVTGTRTVTLDGQQVPVYVIESALTTHGQVESTGTQVDWFAPSLGLDVHVESKQSGSYGLFRFSDNVTSDLVSARPT